jgi:hypothetical protein
MPEIQSHGRERRSTDARSLCGRPSRPVGSTREAIYDKTRGSGLLATDATGIPVLDPDAPEGIRSGTMWGWTNALSAISVSG